MPGFFTTKGQQGRTTRSDPGYQPQRAINRTKGKSSLATPDNVVDRNAAEQQPEDA